MGGVSRMEAHDPSRLRSLTPGKFHSVDVPVWGEIGVTVQRTREALHGDDAIGEDEPSQREQIAERWLI